MAKTKQDLLNEADKLGLNLSVNNTVAEIETAIAEAQTTETVEQTNDSEETFAKAGKRSKKSVEEAEELAAKEERKATGDTTPQDGAVANVEKGPVPIPRKLVDRKGKNYKKLAEKIDRKQTYSLSDALKLAVETSPTKFDATVEI
ncbi:MAG: 50S ribosomal protein L1, partial [Candidatus Nomurabacteria bacterium]|nr:50S ribosomal protein L1 [Candidatus Nomurabacteria bacterium]